MPKVRRYEAPEGSLAIQALLEHAEIAGFDHDKIWEILWLITAHRDLIGFTVAADRLLAILERLRSRKETGWQGTLREAGIEGWAEFLAWVVSEREALVRAVGEDLGREFNTAGNNPVRGSGSSEFPFYAVLCEPLRMGTADDERFLLLSAHLLLAHVIALRDHSTVDDYRRWGAEKHWKFLPNEVDAAARAVRRHAEKGRHRFLANLPLELPPEEFAEDLAHLPEPGDAIIEADRPHLMHFLKKAWGLAPWREGQGRLGRGGGKPWVGGGYENLGVVARREPLGDPDDPFADWGEADWLTPKADSTRRRNALIDSDLDPDEEGAAEEILLSEQDREEARRDPGALARLAGAKTRHVAKRNQLLPWDYALLTDDEFERLYSALQTEAQLLLQRASWCEAERQNAETVVAVMGMLLTSSGIERIHRLQIVAPDVAAPEGDALRLVVSDDPEFVPHWLIPAHEPPYASELDDRAPGMRRRAPSIPLPWRGGRVLELCRRLLKEQTIQKTMPLWATSPDLLGKGADAWLRARFPDRRVTLAKIESYLWLRLAQLTGDPAHAACLFGSQGTLANVRLFYTTLDVERLQTWYGKLLTQLGCPTAVAMPPVAEGIAIGARLCPTKRAVRSAIEGLCQDVMQTRDWRTRSDFIVHHNRLTLYVLQFFAYATAIRAIATPYVELRRIDAERGLAFIDDKDDERKLKTRLAWLPERLMEQMREYEEHLGWVRAQLPDGSAGPARQPCFFLDGGFCAVEARPKEIEQRLAPYLPVKANTHRRFLRTELLERGCSTEVVDALLGHWQIGEEPFGTYSSLSVEAYVSALRRHLAPLLEDVGFRQVIHVRLAK